MPRPSKLSQKKLTQIKRILNAPKKERYLRSILARRGDLPRRNVFLLTIAGKRRVIKIDQHEQLAHANLTILAQEHARAIRSGILTPRHYRLAKTTYDHVDSTFSVMRAHEGVGVTTLLTALSNRNPAERKISTGLWSLGKPYLAKQLREAEAFIVKNPRMTAQNLRIAYDELAKNLFKLKEKKLILSYDLTGADNLIVTGFDPMRKVFRFGLIDQVYLGKEEQTAQQLTIYQKTKKLLKQN